VIHLDLPGRNVYIYGRVTKLILRYQALQDNQFARSKSSLQFKAEGRKLRRFWPPSMPLTNFNATRSLKSRV
jgi:hypothetical protein